MGSKGYDKSMTREGESKVVKYRELIKIDKCARCGYNEFSCSLQVHHKDSDRDNNNLDNLVLLCANCHTALKYDRWELSDIGLENVERALPRHMRISVQEEQQMINSLGIKFR